jgi:hypothetical protein
MDRGDSNPNPSTASQVILSQRNSCRGLDHTMEKMRPTDMGQRYEGCISVIVRIKNGTLSQNPQTVGELVWESVPHVIPRHEQLEDTLP